VADSAAPPLPQSHAWSAALAKRPALRERLRAHLDAIHALAAFDLRPALRPELAELRDAGWGKGDRTLAAARLAAAPPPRGAVLTVGFGEPPFSFGGRVGLLERAVLARLGARGVEPSNAPSLAARLAQPLPTWRVADVHAEARAAAMLAQGRPNVLLLVADDATESRAHATLARNGINVADDGATAHATHALVAASRALVPLFEQHGAALLHYEDLARLMASPVVSRRMPRFQPAEDLEDEKPSEGEGQGEGEGESEHDDDAPIVPGPDRVSLRYLHEAFVACGRLRLSADAWEQAFNAVATRWKAERADAVARGKAGEALAPFDRRIGTARVLAARMQLLTRSASRGTLGALGDFLRSVGLRMSGGDRLGTRIIDSLREAGEQPATLEAFADAIGGGMGSGRLDEGVQILAYDDYDGRAADLLILLDVHDKGLGRVSAPDPFLTDEDRRALGLAPGLEATGERIALARWAVTRAAKAIAIATETDATGRRVAIPVDLRAELSFARDLTPASYGLQIEANAEDARELPEQRDLGALNAGSGSREPDSVCTQVDAEWARAGFAFERAEAPERLDVPEASVDAAAVSVRDPAERSLMELRAKAAPVHVDLEDFFGFVGKERALPADFRLSASRLTNFMQCMYKGFCASVLRLTERDEVSEELDAKARGTRAHAVLEAALKDQYLIVPAARLAQARADILARLVSETGKALAKAGSMGHAPLDRALAGESARWNAHWKTWVETRVRAPDEANDSLLRNAKKGLTEDPAWTAAIASLTEGATLSKATVGRLKDALWTALSDTNGDLSSLPKAPKAFLDSLLTAKKPSAGNLDEAKAVRGRLGLPETKAALQQLGELYRTDVFPTLCPSTRDDQIIATELDFGIKSGKAPLTMRLGAEPISVSGQIDALVRHQGPAADTARWHVMDHKTGAAPKVADMIDSLIAPQLAFYALALEERREASEKDEQAPLPVGALIIDTTFKGATTRVSPSPAQLARARDIFGRTLDSARAGDFALAPHPCGCPLEERGYCAFDEICRHRAGTHRIEEPDGASADDAGEGA
jgi:RecB family exonuclease